MIIPEDNLISVFQKLYGTVRLQIDEALKEAENGAL